MPHPVFPAGKALAQVTDLCEVIKLFWKIQCWILLETSCISSTWCYCGESSHQENCIKDLEEEVPMKAGCAGWKKAEQVLSCCFMGSFIKLTTSMLLEMDIHLLNRNNHGIMESQLLKPSRDGDFTTTVGSQCQGWTTPSGKKLCAPIKPLMILP